MVLTLENGVEPAQFTEACITFLDQLQDIPGTWFREGCVDQSE
jgi:hypothetical protein